MISDTTNFIRRHISVPIKQQFSPFNETGVKFQLLRRKERIKFIVPLNAFTTVRCTEAGIEWLRDERKSMICFEILYVQTSSHPCEISQIVKMLAFEYKNS